MTTSNWVLSEYYNRMQKILPRKCISLGIPFDIDKSWDEKRQQWTISGKIYKTSNITQSARGDKDGKWTTTFAAAVLVL